MHSINRLSLFAGTLERVGSHDKCTEAHSAGVTLKPEMGNEEMRNGKRRNEEMKKQNGS